jgi:hypothetical protein
VTVTSTPTGQDLVCLVCGTDKDIDIDHVQAKGMGGSKERDVPENKSPLCRGHHDAKHRRVLETRVKDGVFEWRKAKGVWIKVPVEVSKRYKCLVGRLSDGAEEESPLNQPAGEDAAGYRPSSAPSLSKEESDPVLSAAAEAGAPTMSAHSVMSGPSSAAAPSAGSKEESDGPVPDGASSRSVGQLGNLGGDSVPLPPLTHEQRVAIAQEIKDAQLQRQWRAGDTANQWEEELGEDFWNIYANEFGYTYPSLRNVMRVCKKIPHERRHRDVSFALHNVMVGHDIETRDAWLERAHDEEWPVKRLREELVEEGLLTTKPKAKRWAVEGLLEEVERWPAPRERLRPRGAVKAYLKWLGGQG